MNNKDTKTMPDSTLETRHKLSVENMGNQTKEFSDEKIEKYNPFLTPIIVRCKAAERISIEKLTKFQGNLKTLSDKNRYKLLKSICLKGFIAPFFIWQKDGINNLIDGTQRLTTLNYMKECGWEIPDLPVAYIEADSEEDAKSKLLSITSQMGEFNTDELNAWLTEMDDEIRESVRLVDTEISFIEEPEIEILEKEDKSSTNDPEPCICPKCGHMWQE